MWNLQTHDNQSGVHSVEAYMAASSLEEGLGVDLDKKLCSVLAGSVDWAKLLVRSFGLCLLALLIGPDGAPWSACTGYPPVLSNISCMCLSAVF